MAAPRVPEMCFWPAKTRKNLKFLDAYMTWTRSAAAQILFRYEKRNRDIASLSLPCFGNIVVLFVSFLFFHLCIKFWFELFWYCSVTETFAVRFHNWFDHEWVDFGVFCKNMPRFVDLISAWTKICKNCSNIARFLATWSLFDH